MRSARLRAWWQAAGFALALQAVALPVAAEGTAFDRVQSATLASSERLRLRVFGLALEAGALGTAERQFMHQDLLAQGYGTSRGAPEITATQLSFAPVLAWDGNINGGVLQDRLDLGGIILEADPAYRAKPGLVFGGTMAAMGRLAWDQGRLFELTGATEIAWSPRHDLGRADAMLRLCSRNHLQNWVFLDLCATGARAWRELEVQNNHRLTAEISRVFAAGAAVHDLGLRFERASTSDGDQNRIGLGLESVWAAGVTEIGLTLGAPQGDATVLRQRLDLGFAWHGAGRDWRLDLWHQRADGGYFLGPRADRAQGIGLAVSLQSGSSLRLGLMSSRSTAAIADYEQVTLDLRFGL